MFSHADSRDFPSFFFMAIEFFFLFRPWFLFSLVQINDTSLIDW